MRVTKADINIDGKTVNLKPLVIEKTAVLLDTNSTYFKTYTKQDELAPLISTRVDQAKIGYEHRTNKQLKCQKFDDNRIKQTKDRITKSLLNQSLPVSIEDGAMVMNKSAEDKIRADLVSIIENNSYINKIFDAIKTYYNIDPREFEKVKNNIFLDSEATEKNGKKNYRQSLIENFNNHIHNNKTENPYVKISNSYIEKLLKNNKQRNHGFIEESKATNQYFIGHIEGKIRYFIGQKLIQLGKGVYHFYDFSLNQFKSENISSFDYQMIKANESMTQQLYICLCFAANNLGGCLDSFKGNILDKSKIDIQSISNHDLKRVKRFFGGELCKDRLPEGKEIIDADCVNEIIKALNKLRNSVVHYDLQSMGEFEPQIIKKLAEYEVVSYLKSIADKYNNLKVCKYFNKQEIVKLIADCSEKREPKAYIPNFKRINTTSEKTLFNIPLISKTADNTEQIERAAAKKFLAKEIYYSVFIYRENLGLEVYDYINSQKNSLNYKLNAEKDRDKKGKISKEKRAVEAVLDCINRENDFAEMCAKLQRQFVDENSKDNSENGGKEKKIRSDNLNILLRKAIQDSFEKFIELNYKWLADEDFVIVETDKDKYKIASEDLNLSPDFDLTGIFPYYVLAKFLPPKQLSCLINEFKKYMSFINDIEKQHNDLKLSGKITVKPRFEPRSIIKMLTICQESCGRISSEISDYYNDDVNPEYTNFLNRFLDEGVLNLIKGKNAAEYKKVLGDTFADDTNFKPKAQIERARMYGLEKILLNAYSNNKINKNDLDVIAHFSGILLNDECASEVSFNTLDEVIAWKKYQWAKNKVELNYISEFSDIISDIYSRMISWCYKFERDATYLVCGISYLRDGDLNVNMAKAYQVFTYSEETKEAKVFNQRLKNFLRSENFEDLFAEIFKKNQGHGDIFWIRNNIDHFDFFKNDKDKSLLGYYYDCYRLLSYDIKLRHDVYPTLKKLLERNKIKAEFDFSKDKVSLETLDSLYADYYLSDESKVKHKVFSDEFIDMICIAINKEKVKKSVYKPKTFNKTRANFKKYDNYKPNSAGKPDFFNAKKAVKP